MNSTTAIYPGTPFYYSDTLAEPDYREVVKIDPALRKISSTKGKFPSNQQPPKKKRKK
jgi:hypothetical protein